MKEFRFSLPAELRFSVWAKTEEEARAVAAKLHEQVDFWEVDGWGPDGVGAVEWTCYAPETLEGLAIAYTEEADGGASNLHIGPAVDL